MPVNTSITSDQSVIELPPVIVTATPPSGAGANPSDVIGPLGGGPNVLRCPSDLPKYYIKFDVYEYRRENLLEVGTLGNVLNTIALALPSQLVDTTARIGSILRLAPAVLPSIRPPSPYAASRSTA